MDFKIKDNFFNFQWSTQSQQDICQYFVLNESLEYIEKHDPEVFIRKKLLGKIFSLSVGKTLITILKVLRLLLNILMCQIWHFHKKLYMHCLIYLKPNLSDC